MENKNFVLNRHFIRKIMALLEVSHNMEFAKMLGIHPNVFSRYLTIKADCFPLAHVLKMQELLHEKGVMQEINIEEILIEKQ